MKLSHIVAKIPNCQLRISSLSFELYATSSIVLVEGEILDKEGEAIASVILPASLTPADVNSLFSVTKLPTSTRRRKITK